MLSIKLLPQHLPVHSGGAVQSLRRVAKRLNPWRRGLLRRVIIALLAFILLAVIIDSRITPVLRDASAAVMKNSASRMINKAVSEQLEDEKITYSQLISLERDSCGAITAILLDAVTVNRLRFAITERLNEAAGKQEYTRLGIPWGNLTGLAPLSGRGSNVKIRVVQYGFVLSEVRSEFTSAGINQTKHSIIIDISVSMQGYAALTHIPVQTQGSVIIAETVIVGEVPNVNIQK